MKNIKKLWPVILIALVLINMQSLQGLSYLELDRANLANVGNDPGGALAIQGLDGGIPSAENLNQAGHLGTITNNFTNPVELLITVEVEILELDYESNQSPRWQHINIFVGGEELKFRNNKVLGDPAEALTTNSILLEPGNMLELSIDEKSQIRLIGNPRILHYFLGVVRFYITGINPDNGDLLFEIYPAGDLRQQFFTDGEMQAEYIMGDIKNQDTISAAETDPSYEADIEVIPLYIYPVKQLYFANLDGQISSLQHDPGSIKAYDSWYEAVSHSENTILYTRFDEPKISLSGKQILRVLVRRTDNSDNTPSFDLDLYQNGEFVSSLVAGEDVYNAAGQVFIYTFEASMLDNLAGAGVEIWLFGNQSGGLTSETNTIEFGAIEWEIGIE